MVIYSTLALLKMAIPRGFGININNKIEMYQQIDIVLIFFCIYKLIYSSQQHLVGKYNYYFNFTYVKSEAHSISSVASH